MNCHIIWTTALLIILQFLAGHQVSGGHSIFYIVPSSSTDTPCPGRITGEPCITLQQYINGEFAQYVSNPNQLSYTTLEFQPGKHTIDLSTSYYGRASGFLSVSYLTSFTMGSKSTNSTLTEIACTHLGYSDRTHHPHISISSIHSVMISGITFKGCRINIYSAAALIVKDSVFDGRRVQSYGEVPLSWLDTGNSLTTVKMCIFEHCTVGLRGDTSSVKTIDQCSFINNNRAVEIINTYWSVHHYPSYMAINHCSFMNNGKAVQIVNGSMQIRNSRFVDNKEEYHGSGGAIKVTGELSSLAVHHCQFINNTAKLKGGAISFGGSSITLDNTAFINNTAEDGGVISVRNASITVLNSTFSHNKANATAGVFLVDDSSLIIKGSSFDSNTAGTTGGVISTKFVNVSLSISQTSFTNNRAGRSGGVLYIGRAGSQVKISKSTIHFNSATSRGGVIELLGSSLQVTSTVIFNNTANHGDVISTCTSDISVSENLVASVDPAYPVCILFDGDINETTAASDDGGTDSHPTDPRIVTTPASG